MKFIYLKAKTFDVSVSSDALLLRSGLDLFYPHFIHLSLSLSRYMCVCVQFGFCWNSLVVVSKVCDRGSVSVGLYGYGQPKPTEMAGNQSVSVYFGFNRNRQLTYSIYLML